ncbi:dynein axonemal heavy chain 17-like [Zonotrichia albicollis]|uniref:dynein axonemal heavy chain 17-like n=1 Tax=Zonotrichia albicollis TaxID=44394 RepID=UPI003D80ED4D
MSDPEQDERLILLENLATALLRVRADKWAKFAASEETSVLLDKFFKQPELLELVLALTPAGQLQPTTSFPPALKGKAFYCVKKKEENITGENCRSALLVGDVGASPVEQLITVLLEVGYLCRDRLGLSRVTAAPWAHRDPATLAKSPGGLQNELKFTEKTCARSSP